MRVTILHNYDFAHLAPGIGRTSQDAVLGVAAAIRDALVARGATVDVVPVGSDPFLFASRLSQLPAEERPQLAVNLCESLGGDARGEMIVPGMLELIGLPYTGSGSLALGLALDKHKAKELLRARGVATPKHALVRSSADLKSVKVPFPAIVKPVHEDASIGIDRHSLVRTSQELSWACERVVRMQKQPALVEHFVEGRELNVALLGDPPIVLPISEIDFTGLAPDHPQIVTYAAKWDRDAEEFHTTSPKPCELSGKVLERVIKEAEAAFEALDCRDYGRVDMRLDSDNKPYVIEVNPNCDLSPDAGFARAAIAAGIDYESLVWHLVEIAQNRANAHTSINPTRSFCSPTHARPDRCLHTKRSSLRSGVGSTGS